MNMLNGTYCYLGGNLENTDDAEGWRKILSSHLKSLGVICLDPTKQMFKNQCAENEEVRTELKEWRDNCEYQKISDFMKAVIRRDLRAIDISTFTIFKLEPEKPTWGTVHEIVLASQQRKPILILIDDVQKMPLWLIGLINMNYVFESIHSLVFYLNAINNGEIVIDEKYWKLLELDS